MGQGESKPENSQDDWCTTPHGKSLRNRRRQYRERPRLTRLVTTEDGYFVEKKEDGSVVIVSEGDGGGDDEAIVSSTSNTVTTTTDQGGRRIAVIGGGVAGLAATWHLCHVQRQERRSFDGSPIVESVHLFEASSRVGGHAWTVDCNVAFNKRSDQDASSTTTTTVVPVDIGFMVFNQRNYPNLMAWFQALSESTTTASSTTVQAEASNMSLSISLQTKNAENNNAKSNNSSILEWSSDLGYLQCGWYHGVIKQVWTLTWHIGPFGIVTLIRDFLRFHATALHLLRLHVDDPRRHVTMNEYVTQQAYSTLFVHYYLYPMMAALWSSSAHDVQNFPAAQCIAFLGHHQMLQVTNRPSWQTVRGRSVQYVQAAVQDINSSNNSTSTDKETSPIHVHTPIHSIQQLTDGTYQLYTTVNTTDKDQTPVLVTIGGDSTDASSTAAAIFDDVIFACHTTDTAAILQRSHFSTTYQAAQAAMQERNGANATAATVNANATAVPESEKAVDYIDPASTMTLLQNMDYADNVIYVHSDESLMPARRRAWASWNCLGKSPALVTTRSDGLSRDEDTQSLEGPNGRFKAVYVTYWLNRLQNLTSAPANIFVSLNPHQPPSPALTYHRVVMAHPQFTPKTLAARHQLLSWSSSSATMPVHQGANGLWYCGAWTGYGFHEDGCRSGFEVATAITGVSLPWVPAAASHSSFGFDDDDVDGGECDVMVLPPPDLTAAIQASTKRSGIFSRLYQGLVYDLPVAICKRFIYYFLNQAVQNGTLRLKFNDGSIKSFGNGTPCGSDSSAVTLRIFDPWFFVKTAWEYDLGLARSYMAGYFVVEPLEEASLYHPALRPASALDETTVHIGDPVGLTRLFLLLIGNRDRPMSQHRPQKAGRGNTYSNAFTNASGLFIGKLGSLFNFLRYKLTMDNSERGGSLRNIHAHYDLSNDLFSTFLDKETMTYSSAIFYAIRAPSPQTGLVYRGTLEEAQWRKLDTLLERAQVQPGQELLDIGFGWGGLSIRAAKKYGCHVTGITLSVEQKALAEKRVQDEGLQSLISFEVIDYRTFARRKENQGRFDRVLSCEMIEAVGHRHLGEFFWAVERVLAQDGILVMEAITTPEQRYESYIRSTDFINTVIFPGSCCPSLHALIDAAYQQSTLTLEHIDNIGLHYAHTLAEWRRRFNVNETTIRSLGFDDVFLRAWNYYLTYCEAGFFSQTENCLILVFSRQGCKSLVPLCETRSVTQGPPLSLTETSYWITDGVV